MSETLTELAVLDTGYPWLGAIPSHWITAELRRIAEVKLGKMLQAAPSGPDDVEMSYVSAINVQPEGLSLEPEKSMWFSLVERNDLTIEPGDVLVVEGGSVGRSVYLAKGLDGWRFQNSINRVRSNPALSVGRFIDYALKHLQSEGVIEMVCNKATIMHLTAEKLGRLRIAVPPVDEQTFIADYLDRETADIDEFIADQGELIALLIERRTAAITRAVTKGLNPDVDMKSSGVAAIAEFPKHWVREKLSRLGLSHESGTSVNGYSDAEDLGAARVLKTGCASKGYFDPSENKRVVEDDLDRVSCPVRQGSLIVNRANTPDLVGSAAIVEGNHPNLYLSDKLWQINFSRSDNRFMYWWMKTGAYKSQIRFHIVGASASMQNLSLTDFKGFAIALPPMAEQVEIADHLDFETAEIDAAIADAKEAIELSKERRAALISAAVTGKIDVRDHKMAELGAA